MAEERDEQREGTPNPRSFWSGTLTFGLVSVPVDLFPAVRARRIGLRMLGPEQQPLVPLCGIDGRGHQRAAQARAVEARQGVDALEFDVAGLGGVEIGLAHQRETDRRAAGLRLGEPGARAVGEIGGIAFGAVLRGAVADDRLTVENAREGLEEGRRADQRQRLHFGRTGLAQPPGDRPGHGLRPPG